MVTGEVTEAAGALEGFATFADGVREAWRVPGAAIAVVRDGEVLLTQGFGMGDVEQGTPVTARTLFAIASCTKAFTTLGLATLADEGKLDWDAPVRTYLPAFRLHDPVAGERATTRDLVTHRSGLPRHDMVWYGTAASREELLGRLQYLEPAKDFRSIYQYQNLMYMAAGYLAGQRTGQSWEELTWQRILEPLGMVRTNFSVTHSQTEEDIALPYQEDFEQDVVKRVPFCNIDAIGPAGGINSCAEDMARWLQLQLGLGKVGERQIVSAGQLAHLHTPQMVSPATDKYPELPPLASYALGWTVQIYRGNQMVSHGGGIDGFSSLVALLPARKIGVLVLTNLGGTPLPSILTYQVFDRLLGLAPAPWDERMRAERTEFKAARAKGTEQADAGKVAGTQPSHPLAEYAGEYEHPGYGIMTVSAASERLTARLGTLEYALEHFHYDIFTFSLTGPVSAERRKVAFVSDIDGRMSRLEAPLEPTGRDIVFRRRSPDALRQDGAPGG